MTELATTEKKIATIREMLSRESFKDQIRMVAPKHLTPDRITRIAMTSIQRTPKLALCEPKSLLGALLTCSQLGLEPDSVSGRAYLIPYGNQCTLIVGYRGLMELARRSDEIASLEARVVHEVDEFDFAYGAEPFCRHKPNINRPPGAKAKAAYAIAHLKSGGIQFEVMSFAEIEAIRGRSRAGSSGPWVTDWPEMARKTVMRRLCKYLPSSAELSQAVSLDEQADVGIPQNLDVIDVDGESTDVGVGTANEPKKLADLVPTHGRPMEQPPAKRRGRPPKATIAEPRQSEEDLHRVNILKNWNQMNEDRRAVLLINCDMQDIKDIETMDLPNLQSVRDAMMGV